MRRAVAVRSLVEAAGCRPLCLPPYPPDLDSVAQAWGKPKALLRSAGARTVGALHAALHGAPARGVDAVTPRDAAGYFRHAGYPVQ